MPKATVLGNYVYIDGGAVSQDLSGESVVGPSAVNSTISIDLSKSWFTSTVKLKATPKGNNGPVPLYDQVL